MSIFLAYIMIYFKQNLDYILFFEMVLWDGLYYRP